jgi:3-methyladenine DNA glycosylase/8-oxoguanine DNA glycosylase
MDRKNISPFEDMAFLQGFVWYNRLQTFPKQDTIKNITQKREPYRSVMARYLCRVLDNELTKRAFDSYID